MKLEMLADPVKAAYRQGKIDTATAEVFAVVPAEKQADVWPELRSCPQHAQHVRNVAQLESLIDLLTVECVTAHLLRRTELVWRLAGELGVDVRRHWRPDERWLAGYQKIQLAHLIGELRGPAYGTAAERKKKSELVSELAKLFADAAEGRMEDARLAAKLNAWLPANLREEPHGKGEGRASAA